MKKILTLFFSIGLLLGNLAISDSFAQTRRSDGRRSDVRRDDGRRSDDAFLNEEPATNSKLNIIVGSKRIWTNTPISSP